MDAWLHLAHLIKVNYGTEVNFRDGFCVCPDCGEPIYQIDWDDTDLVDGNDNYMCPICGSEIE